VGANLVRRLLREGSEVHLMSRKGNSDWRIHEITDQVRWHEVSVEDRDGVRSAARNVRPDWVFHLAAYGAYPHQSDVDRMVSTNVTGSMALLDACAESGVEAFIQTGSSSEYGFKNHPAREDELLEPNSAYAVSKAAATHYCQFVARRWKLNAIVLRLYSIYGPYEEPTRLVPTLIAQGVNGCLPPLANPRTARDFVYVDDAIEAMLRVAAAAGLTPGSIYNVCSGMQTDLAAIVAEVRAILDIQAEPAWETMPARAWDTNAWVGDPAAILRDTGWRAETSLSDGLRKTVRWFRELSDQSKLGPWRANPRHDTGPR
jgi:nucleoside-diphosphate-sugar epimerase